MTKESLIEFPCAFPIKVMGRDQPGFQSQIATLVQELVPDFDPQTITAKPSSKGSYLGLTVTVTVVSQAQLDNIYRALHGHEMVAVVL